jgi:hypothetical protein
MSKNSKNAQKHAKARQWSAQRQNGSGGPARTQKKSTKIKVWWKKSAEERAKLLERRQNNETEST